MIRSVKKPIQPLLTLIAGLLAVSSGLAQSVTWEPAGGQLGYGKTNRLSLVFDGCQPADDFRLPSIDGLDVSQPARSEQTNIINFKVSRRVELSYAVQPTRRGEIVIPPLNILTNEGRLRVEEARFEVVEAKVGGTNLNIDEIVTALLQVPTEPVWEGQVIEIAYVLLGSGRFTINLSSEPQWSPDGLLIEPFSEPERVSATIDGEERIGLRYRTRALVRKTGALTLAAVQQRVNIQTGDRSGFFISRPQVEEFLISSNDPVIQVRPLPTPAPAGFKGAVGVFTLDSTVVPTETNVGDPVTWTLKLEGTGNWPQGITLPERKADVAFKVIQPQSRKELAEGKLFTGSLTEDVVLVPTRAGDTRLGAADFTFFNPENGRYETQSGSPVTVRINPMPHTASATPSASADPGVAADSPAALPIRPPLLESTGPALPRDPLVDRSPSATPFVIANPWWAGFILLPAGLTWIWQMIRRFLADDPSREAKRARRELGVLSATLESTTDPAGRRALLPDWMRLATRALRLPAAAPPPAALESHLAAQASESDRNEWHRLWSEAEDALYGPAQALADDWPTRARRLAGRIRMRRRPPTVFFRRRYWLPLLLLLPHLPVQHGEAAPTAIDLYREGDYAGAEAIWREEIAASPLDPTPRNNLALALAQKERWPEANAYWISAFVLNPNHPDIRWNLQTGLSRAAGLQPRLAELLDARGFDWLATRLSPGAWNRLQAAGAFLAMSGLVLIVFGLFRRLRFALMLAPIALFSGTLGLGLGTLSVLQYGVLAHPDAVVVSQDSVLRSIPTEVADTQQSRSLPAGEIGRIDGAFLSWRRIRLDSGETGWVRRSVLVPIHTQPNADGT